MLFLDNKIDVLIEYSRYKNRLVEKVTEVEVADFSNVDLGLPTSSGRTSKFVSKTVDELTYELDKADREFKFKAMNPGANAVKRKQAEQEEIETRTQESDEVDVKPKGRWRSIAESGGLSEVTEDEPDIPVQTVKVFEHADIKDEVKEELLEHGETQVAEVFVEAKKEPIAEKIVSLNLSNKKQKVIGFKKRSKNESNFKERCADD